MQKVHFIPPSQRRWVILAAQADTAPVMISGASGTGREGIALWIHHNSSRAARPILTAHLNTPVITQLLAAQGGTFLIPEVGTFPLAEQMALLNFLKTKSIPHPANKGASLLLNVRLIATTSQMLERRAQAGLFNPEFLERLSVFRVEMPPLSQRKEEFEDIALGMIEEITRELHREHLREVSSAAWARLKAYDWPANLRELRNVLKVAIIAARGDRIEELDLPAFGSGKIDFHATREEFEKTYILELLKSFNWELDKTCHVTRLDKSTLLQKMEKYGIPRDPAML